MLRWLFCLVIASAFSLTAIAQCACPDGIGAFAGDMPFLSITTGDARHDLVLCGDAEKALSETTWKASEFEVIECSGKKVLLSFGALEDCIVTKEAKDSIVIIKTVSLPLGKNRSFEDVPLDCYTIKANGADGTKIHKVFVFAPPQYSTEQAKEIMNLYHDAVANRKHGDDMDHIIGMIALLAMSGSKEGQAAFERASEDLKLDGCYGEYYGELYEIYREHYKK